jgi:hypothetical protein
MRCPRQWLRLARARLAASFPGLSARSHVLSRWEKRSKDAFDKQAVTDRGTAADEGGHAAMSFPER